MTMSAEIETLLKRVAERKRRAFVRLYEVTSAQVFGVICTVLKDDEAAQKALHDTYAKIWRTADRYPESGLGPVTWVVTHARNIAVDRFQRMPDAFDGVADDVLQQIYWRGDGYCALALWHGETDDVMRSRVAAALSDLQERVAP